MIKYQKLINVILCIFICGYVLSGCSQSSDRHGAESHEPASTAHNSVSSPLAPASTPAAVNPDIIPLPIEVQGSSYWKGKKIAFLGDSITELNGFQATVKELLQADTIYSYGKSGTTIGGDNLSFTNSMSQVADDADLIFVFGGTNDFHISWPLGSMDSRVNKNSFYGATRMICEYFQENYSEAVIVFITPLQRTLPPMSGEGTKNARGFELVDYVDAIIEVCKVYEIPVLDLYETSAITVETAEQYLYDGIHPNAEGFAVLANEMVSYLCPGEDLTK